MSPPRQSVLITGCSKDGIGSALAKAFHEDGYRVIATARTVSKMADLEALGIETLPLDVLDNASIAACVSKVSSKTDGKLDMLVNNAGGGYITPLLDADLQKGRELFDLNFWSVIAITQQFAPLVIKAKGRIVNNTSIAAVFPSPWQGIYNASKAATVMFSETLRNELKPFGVRVIDVRTGRIRTNFGSNRMESDNELVPNSLYNVAKKDVEVILKDGGLPDNNADDPVTFARAVVKDLRGDKSPAQIWKGLFAGRCWFLSCFVPSKVVGVAVARMGKLNIVKRNLQLQAGKA